MTVNTAKVSGRRKLNFADFSQLLADAEHVANTPCQTLGNWSVGQILDHLAVAANGPFDGYGGFQAPWWLRKLIIPFIKNNILTKPMSPGFQLPKKTATLLPEPGSDPLEAYARLQTALARFATETPRYAHPAFGTLAFQEWVALTLRHSEMHLSFVIPAETAAVV